MKEVDVDCGVMRESICRYAKTLQKQHKLFKIEKKRCSVTKYIAYTYSTDSTLIPISNQLSLFDHE